MDCTLLRELALSHNPDLYLETAMRTKLLAVVVVLGLASVGSADDGLTKGTPNLQSAAALAFGPSGLLFVGDALGATVYAIDTGDTKPTSDKPVNVERVDGKLAAALGTTEKDIRINDVKVNPASGNVYLAVTRGTGNGQPAIVKVGRDGNIEPLLLKDVRFASVKLPNPGKPTSREPLGVITGMAFIDGRLFVAGLSSEEFASTLRAIPFPFKEADRGAGIQIFHGAHGRLETQAPIKAFTPYKIGKEDHIIASYTCTPLVKIPVSELKAGAKVKGTTIAELGNGNQPLDMIAYTKDGKDFLLSANTRHGVLKIPTSEFATISAITEPVKGTAGVKAEKIESLTNVRQLDKFDADRIVILVQTDAGMDLKTIPVP
jgi:secreted PhoX family phosphatase